MAIQQDIGVKGEQLAAEWLIQQGYSILQRNWRLSHYEIDIVASKDDMLHFIEVKSRFFSPHSNPEDSVGKKKFQHMQRAGDYYLLLNPGHEWIQYDVLAVTFHKNGMVEYFLLEDVFL